MYNLFKICFVIGLLFWKGDLFAQKRTPLEWQSFGDLDFILKEDEKKNSKILLYFYTDWCVYCRKMEQAVFTNPDIKEKLNREYIFIKFDAETDEEIEFEGVKYVKEKGEKYHFLAKTLASRNQQLVFPTFLIVDENFKILKNNYAYMSIKQFQSFLSF